MKAIQKELGDLDDTQKDIADLKEKIEAAGMPEESKKDALKELGRLARMNPAAADYSLTRNYVEWLAVLPWSKTSSGEVDIQKAKEFLDEDHYGLKKVKDRILDYLSVRRLKPDMKGPILCFVGPPGVGKTSLGRSIARALGPQILPHLARRHARRGRDPRPSPHLHRRAARPDHPAPEARRGERPRLHARRDRQAGPRLPRRPRQRAARNARPGAEQHVPRQLPRPALRSVKVLFICTANQLDTIPAPLLDRMEIIELTGYTEEEKVTIAERYLIPRQIKENGIEPSQEHDRVPDRERRA